MLSKNIHHWELCQHFYGRGSFDIQTNPEWLKIRKGKFTASQASDLLTSEKSGDGLGRLALKAIDRVFSERYTPWQEPDDSQSWSGKPSVARGLILEPFARACYERQSGLQVRQCGFVEHSSGVFGFSPDGMIVNRNGGVEIKSPEPPEAKKLLREMGSPEHLKQMAYGIWMDDLDFYDYVIFCPELYAGVNGLYTQEEMAKMSIEEIASHPEMGCWIFTYFKQELMEYISALDVRAPILIQTIIEDKKYIKALPSKPVLFQMRRRK